MAQAKIPMTPRGAQQLKDELKRRKETDRFVIVRAIEEARGHGDLSENADYSAAKEAQSFNEGRIKELEGTLALSEVIDPAKMTGTRVTFGATVKLTDSETGEDVVYSIVGEQEADIKKGLISVTAPVARALGEALARMHLAGPAPAPLPPLGAGRFGADELVARCDRIAKSTDAEARVQSEPLRDAIIRTDRRRRTDLPKGLVHGDLFRDNVLWHEGKIAALLDFESAHTGPLAYDLAVVSLSWAYRDSFDFVVARALVAGYQSVRELLPVEVEGLYAELVFASLRFTVTRITDDAIRVGKRWQRFVARREALEQLGPAGVREALSP